ncbi:hypothetical protein CR513_38717, partial [Mucuna pruriens]
MFLITIISLRIKIKRMSSFALFVGEVIILPRIVFDIIINQCFLLNLRLKYHVINLELNYVFNSNDWFINFKANIHESSTLIVSMGNGSMTLPRRRSSEIRVVSRKPSYFKWSLSSYKVVFEFNRVVITRHGVFVSKGYICDGFMLYLLHILFNKKKTSNPSLIVANIECCDIMKYVYKQSNLESLFIYALEKKLTCLNEFIVMYVIEMC